jgi:hypothetical protein
MLLKRGRYQEHWISSVISSKPDLTGSRLHEKWAKRIDVNSEKSVEDQIKELEDDYLEDRQIEINQAVATGVYKYTPKGISLNPIDLTLANQAVGIMVCGTVDESMMPQYVDASVKALLPLIRFI